MPRISSVISGKKVRSVGELLARAVTFKEDPYVEVFNLLSCPGSFAQKGEARLYARILGEALYVDFQPKSFPGVFLYEFLNLHLEGNAMEWGVFLGCHMCSCPLYQSGAKSE